MALPFLAGVALGGLAVVAFNNKDKIKSSFNDKFKEGLSKGKALAGEVRGFAKDKFNKTKDENSEHEIKVKTQNNEQVTSKEVKKTRKPRTTKQI